MTSLTLRNDRKRRRRARFITLMVVLALCALVGYEAYVFGFLPAW